MSGTIGSARITLQFHDTFSLKDKRGEVKRLTDRISNRFNCAIAEIEDLDDLRVATLGVLVLSTSANHASQMVNRILTEVERLLQISTIADVATELYPFE